MVLQRTILINRKRIGDFTTIFTQSKLQIDLTAMSISGTNKLYSAKLRIVFPFK